MLDAREAPKMHLHSIPELRRFATLLISALHSAVYAVGLFVILGVLTAQVLSMLIGVQFAVPPPAGAVVITGATSGLGEDAASTIAAARPSMTVFAGVRKPSDARRLEAQYPGLRTLALDVTSPESIAAAVQTVADSGLELAALVNNAGVQLDLPVELQSSEADRLTYAVNVFGVLDVTRAFLPLLRRTGDGARVVIVGSLAGVTALAGSASYSSSKFAVEGIADSLRREVQPFGISVSLLQPGYVRSRMGGKQHASSSEHYGVSDESYRLYRPVFDGFFADDRRLSSPELAASPATTTTPAIMDAIFSPTPQTRYPVAAVDRLPASVATLAQKLLPDRLMDLLV
jgi:NAD(P)-dependent dehydrogenase (short-subunit alcohol dehydrogenase family)